MKSFIRKILVILYALVLSAALLLSVTCIPPGNDDEASTCRCEEMGGVCSPLLDACPEGTFDWSNLECPGGREAKCCLPDDSCTALGGICLNWEEDCPEGTNAYSYMDCPNGRYDQCCVPTR